MTQTVEYMMGSIETSTSALFNKYSSALRSTSPPTVRDPRLLMESDGLVQIFYAPFEYVNALARVVLVGITPGPTQMVNANNAARRALLGGASVNETLRVAKQTASFSGEPMRGNLIKQLNHWGFHRWLGLRDSAELFSTAAHLLQSTSLLRYPVFVAEKDYRGTPAMIKNPVLRQYLVEYFVAEVAQLRDAVFVGLGPQVQKVLDELVKNKLIDANRIISGMLHPSGNCTYRIKYLVGARRKPVPHATNPEPYDLGRQAFQSRFLATC